MAKAEPASAPEAASASASASVSASYYVVLDSVPPDPPFLAGRPRSRSRSGCWRCEQVIERVLWALFWTILGAAAAAGVYTGWPRDPRVEVSKMRILHLQCHLFPQPSLDVSLAVTARVENPNLLGLYYRHLFVQLAYRGERIGDVTSPAGYVPARSTASVDANVDLVRIDVADILSFWEDITRGTISFTSVAHFDGYLRFLGFSIPLQATVNCEVLVAIKDRTITSQDCSVGSLA